MSLGVMMTPALATPLVSAILVEFAHERGAGVVVVTQDHRTLDVFDLVAMMEDGRVKPSPQARETTTNPDES